MMNLKTLSMITLTAAFLYGCSSDSGGGTAGTGGTGNSATGGNGGITGATGGNGGITGGGGTVAATTCGASEPGCWVSTTDVPGIKGVYAFGDGTSTAFLTYPSAGKVCMQGQMAQQCATGCPNGGGDYSLWGMGMGMQLSTGAMAPHTPWDATAAGVTGVKFTLSTPPAGGVRAQISLVSDDQHGFVLGGDNGAITTDGVETSAQFTEFVQPSWGCPAATTSAACGTPPAELMWDGTQLDAIQFQAVSVDTGTTDYMYCVSNIQFIDAAGTVVNVPPQVDTNVGGAGGGQ